MIIKKTSIPDCKIIIPKFYKDNRGSFAELYNWRFFKKEINIDRVFLQDNISISKKNVLRGLHFQLKKPQGKLVKVISGKIFDVAVDLRPKSVTFKNILVLFCHPKTKRNFGYQKVLHMVFTL